MFKMLTITVESMFSFFILPVLFGAFFGLTITVFIKSCLDYRNNKTENRHKTFMNIFVDNVKKLYKK